MASLFLSSKCFRFGAHGEAVQNWEMLQAAPVDELLKTKLRKINVRKVKSA